MNISELIDVFVHALQNKVDSHRNGSEAHRRKEDIDGGTKTWFFLILFDNRNKL